MDLFQVLLNISHFKGNETIYAVEPWTPESEAQVILEPAAGIIQLHQGELVFEYFLEIDLLQKMLQNSPYSDLCLRDQCLHVIEYVMQNA